MLKKIVKLILSATGIPLYLFRVNLYELRMLLIRVYGYTPVFYFKMRNLKNRNDIRLVFGCGQTQHTGWVNIDCFLSKNVDLLLDLRQILPFSDVSIRYCYSEHFLEHLFPDEAKKHFSEVFRVLKPGGVYRVVVPDANIFMKKYVEGDDHFFKMAHPWETYPIDAIYAIFNWGGEHKSIYDFDKLVRLATNVGFKEVARKSVNYSNYPELQIDSTECHRVAESLYVEIKKPN